MTENDITGLLLKLADLGVTGINVRYSGGGDSGCIDEISYTTDILNEDEYIAFDDLFELSAFGIDVGKKLNDLDSGVYSDIENFTHDKILNDIEDWWNNDGGFGTLCILVPSGKYKIQNTLYITNTEEFTHEGDLISKTLN